MGLSVALSGPPTTKRVSRKRTSSQACKRSSMRQFVALDMSSHMGYCRIHNKRRKQWQSSHLSLMMKNFKSKILSTNTASHLPGWKKQTITLTCLKELGSVQRMAAQLIPGSGTEVTSSINISARASRANHPHLKGSVQAHKHTSTRARANKRG
jgi:hypothetical protein